MAHESSKGRLLGFAALGVLALLVVVAFYSERGSTATGSAGVPEAPAPAIGAPSTTSVTESLPQAPARGSTIPAVAEDVALSPKARLLAERFLCVCGCKDILSTCTCKETPGSRDMKKYVQQLVDEGKTPGEVEAAMVARYGEKVLP